MSKKKEKSNDKPLIARGWFHMMIWSFGMFTLIGISFWSGKPIPPGAVTLYGLVLGCYSLSKTAVKVTTGKSSGEVKLHQ